ncbi:hypothetical protein JST97_06340 [bacterium]|nr:hypothetical protein [bacterium]
MNLLPTLRGAIWGILGGAIAAGYLQFSLHSFSFSEAAGLQFGALIISFCGGSALLAPKLQPNLDPTTAAAVAAIAGLTFGLVTATLAVASGASSAVLGGALVGAAIAKAGSIISETA